MPSTAVEPLVCPFAVVIDTREQRPFAFADLRSDAKDGNRLLDVPVQCGTLGQGDYSILGMEQWIAIERKNLADLFGTLGRHRGRFERELARLQTLEAAAVVVEGDWEDVLLHPPPHSGLQPKSVFRSVIAWQQRFPKVHWNLMPSRRLAEVFTFRFLERFWKDRVKGFNPSLANR
jgi:DNA excision repair protein ERCC-4